MSRVYNFSAGPSAMPDEVLQRAQAEFLEWGKSGMSVMEMSHRGKDFVSIAEKAEADFREILGVPANYKVLFLPGGATGQFAAIPLNLKPPICITPRTRPSTAWSSRRFPMRAVCRWCATCRPISCRDRWM